MKPIIVVFALLLTGCASNNYELVMDRFDGKPIDAVELARVKTECRAAAVQAGSTVGYQGPGLVGAVASATMQRQASDAAAEACLARYGIRATIVVKPPSQSQPPS